MILFISKVNPFKGVINISSYNIHGQEIKTKQTNVSAVAELTASVGRLDKIFAFVSHDVQQEALMDGVQQSSLAVFKEGVKEYIAEEDIVCCDYDEDKNIEESLVNINKMANTIWEETSEYRKAGEEIFLHADMTGGLRNASMMMLGIMRFLEYSKFKLGKVLYSNWQRNRAINWVEDAKGVYRFFDLVAGAKEFANYGSIKEIESYFDKQEDLSRPLVALLAAMKNFSENIKLCHYGNLKKSIEELRTALINFEALSEAERDNNDRLLAVMLPTIKKEYEELLVKELDDLEIISWCEKKDYLQQAMTLCTERIPEYLFEHGLLAVNAYKKASFDQAYINYRKKDGGSVNFFALNNWYPTDPRNLSEKVLKAVIQEIKQALGESLNNGILAAEFLREKLAALVHENEYLRDGQLLLTYDIEKVRTLEKSMNYFWEHRYWPQADSKGEQGLQVILLSYDKGWNYTESPWERKEIFKFAKYLSNSISDKLIREALGLEVVYTSKGDIEKKWAIVENNIKKGIFKTSISTEKLDILGECIRNYNWLKFERNASNHARVDEVKITINDIKDKIREIVVYVKELENIERNFTKRYD